MILNYSIHNVILFAQKNLIKFRYRKINQICLTFQPAYINKIMRLFHKISVYQVVNFLLNLSAINILTVKEGLLVDGPIVAAVFKIKITFFSKEGSNYCRHIVYSSIIGKEQGEESASLFSSRVKTQLARLSFFSESLYCTLVDNSDQKKNKFRLF